MQCFCPKLPGLWYHEELDILIPGSLGVGPKLPAHTHIHFIQVGVVFTN